MKSVFVGLFMMLALSSFVFAASSEIVADFSVNVPTGEVSKYVPAKSFVGDYLGYFVLVFVILAFAYFAFKKNGTKVKRVRKKVSARKSVPARKGTKVPSSSGRKKKSSKKKK